MTTRNSKTKKKSLITSLRQRLTPGDWVLIPLLGVVLFSLYFASAYHLFESLFAGLTLYSLPLLAIPLTGIFSLAYLVFQLRRWQIPRLSRIVAFIFSATFILGLIIAAFTLVPDSMQRSCTGFFGAQTPCSDIYALTFFVLVFHPVMLVIWGIIAAYGLIPLVVRFFTEHR